MMTKIMHNVNSIASGVQFDKVKYLWDHSDHCSGSVQVEQKRPQYSDVLLE